jgi:hypothetical protein
MGVNWLNAERSKDHVIVCEMKFNSGNEFWLFCAHGRIELFCVVPCECQGTVATWLILPVVIRSSQRLSHARLSINLLL